MLDVATGTGDLAIELARRVSPSGEVVGSDFAEAMLDRARAKAAASARARAPALRMGRRAGRCPIPTTAFDAATVGFGARNFDDLPRGLAEMARVVRPGGRVVVLEITTPTRAPLSHFYALWFDRIVPALGRVTGALAARSHGRGGAGEGTIAQAYTYLPNSVKRFPGPAQLAAEMQRVGLTDIALRDHRRRHHGDPRRHRSPRAGIMSAVSSTAASVPAGDVDGLDAIMRRGGESLRRRMQRTERHLGRGDRVGVRGQRRAPR